MLPIKSNMLLRWEVRKVLYTRNYPPRLSAPANGMQCLWPHSTMIRYGSTPRLTRFRNKEYKEIMKYVDVLYNIPDLDKTGIRKGTELALTYLDIHTVWLPSWLNNYKDQRSNPVRISATSANYVTANRTSTSCWLSPCPLSSGSNRPTRRRVRIASHSTPIA